MNNIVNLKIDNTPRIYMEGTWYWMIGESLEIVHMEEEDLNDILRDYNVS